MLPFSSVACGGGGQPPISHAPATVTATRAPASVAAPSAPSGGLTTPEGLCGLLKAEDWQQFNYVTAATPDVSSDGEGTAICTWANGLTLEVYTHDTVEDAEATFDTIVENVPMDEASPYYVQGAAQSLFDSDIGDNPPGWPRRPGG